MTLTSPILDLEDNLFLPRVTLTHHNSRTLPVSTIGGSLGLSHPSTCWGASDLSLRPRSWFRTPESGVCCLLNISGQQTSQGLRLHRNVARRLSSDLKCQHLGEVQEFKVILGYISSSRQPRTVHQLFFFFKKKDLNANPSYPPSWLSPAIPLLEGHPVTIQPVRLQAPVILVDLSVFFATLCWVTLLPVPPVPPVPPVLPILWRDCCHSLLALRQPGPQSCLWEALDSSIFSLPAW